MYTSYFGLSEKPFAITPDPRYLYLSERHAEALAHLLYGINESGGFIQLTGEVGTGKTTVVRTLLSRLPQHADVAVIMNPRISPAEFLLTICEELGLTVADADRSSVKQLVDALNRHLLSAHAEGKRVIVIVDEAQNLSAEVLEQVRLLTNLETPTQKLLQIILIGQPELRELLDRTDLRQLAQRITGRYHLSPLRREEAQAYIRHRLRVAGAAGEIFTAGALNEVFRLSAGVPRVINVCCDRALLGAYTQETRQITPALVRQAAGEVYGRRFTSQWLGWLTAVFCGAALVLALFVVWRYGAPAFGALRAAFGPPSAAHVVASPPRRPGSIQPAVTPSAGPAAAAGAIIRPAAADMHEAVSINAVLAQNPAQTTDVAAFRRLLSLWGTAMTEDRDPCAQASKAGLSCLEQRGSWAQVRMLNRPAVLTLIDEHGRRQHVVLTGLSDRLATLALGEHNIQVALDDLSRVWFGEFTVVWKPKTPRARLLTVGMSGDEVRWLRRSLNALHGAAADPARSDVYDQELAIAVQNFQREHRLNVDGIAGLQTQVVLDTALAEPGSPMLLPASARGS
jgi:general secretion pathway protein A